MVTLKLLLPLRTLPKLHSNSIPLCASVIEYQDYQVGVKVGALANPEFVRALNSSGVRLDAVDDLEDVDRLRTSGSCLV